MTPKSLAPTLTGLVALLSLSCLAHAKVTFVPEEQSLVIFPGLKLALHFLQSLFTLP